MIQNKKWIVAFIGAVSLAALGFSAGIPGQASAEETMNVYTEPSPFAVVADKAMPATVFIKTVIEAPQQQYLNPFEMFGDDFFHRFFGQQFGRGQQQPQQQQLMGGSGFLITDDGYIVTNYHVIKDATQILVTLGDGREFTASIKGSDQPTALAVLKIEEKNLPHISFGDSDATKIGDWVVAIGNPFGLGGTVTAGIVGGKGRQDLGIAYNEDFIQTDAAINPGNSGGPLLNLRGEVVGVNTAIFSRSGGYMGIGFAIPSRMAQSVIDQILNNGAFKRGYLGIVPQLVDKDFCDAMGLDKQEGILVADLMKDSPAAKGGLQQGDIIIQYNDKSVKSITKFRNDIAMMSPGSEIKMKVLRNSKTESLTLQLGAQDNAEAISAEVIQKLGIEIENITAEIAARLGLSPDAAGVVVSKVKPGSPAAMAGLRPGNLITGIALNSNNQKPVRNTHEFDEAVKEIGDKKHLILIARYQNFQRYYTIKFN